MDNRKTNGYINRYILGWATKILIAFFIVIILVFVFFRWTGAITKTPFSWERPTIELADNKSSKPIVQRTNQLWVTAKFKEHHANVKEATIFVKDEKNKKIGEQDLSKGTNTYIFNGITEGSKKVYSHLKWSLYGDETYYLGEATMSDITSMDVNESSIKSDFDGTSFNMETLNPNDFYTMEDLKKFPENFYSKCISYLNIYIFQPWLGENYGDLIEGPDKEKWINMPLAFNVLINDEHELNEIIDVYNNKGIKGLKEISDLPNKLISSFIPQPYIIDNEEETKSFENLSIQEGEHNYKFNKVLTNNHEFISLKDYSNKKTNFKIIPLGIAYKKNDDGHRIPYIVTSGNIIKSYAIGTPEIIMRGYDSPVLIQTGPTRNLFFRFYIKKNNFEFIDNPKIEIKIKQTNNGEHEIWEDKDIKNLSDLLLEKPSKGIEEYTGTIKYDYLKNTKYFNTLDENGIPIDHVEIELHMKITYELPGSSDKILETYCYPSYWLDEEPDKNLSIDSLSETSNDIGELNNKTYKDYDYIFHPDWIQFESRSGAMPIANYIRLNWKQAYWTIVPENKFRIEFQFFPFDQFGFGSNWFSFLGHEDEIEAKDMASTKGRPDKKSEPWDFHMEEKVQQYNDDDEPLEQKEEIYKHLWNKKGDPITMEESIARNVMVSASCSIKIRIIGNPIITDFWGEEKIPITTIDPAIYNLNDGIEFWLFDAIVDDDEKNEVDDII